MVADVFDGLRQLHDEGVVVDLVMTSPPIEPFLALRSYLPADHPDKSKEIGSEPTPADFIDTMLDVVEACASILAPHGSICFELGDTYAGSGGAGGDYAEEGLRAGQNLFDGSARRSKGRGWPQDKSLTLIPSLFAASLAYGRNLLRPERETEPWRVRNLVAWVRPNPPVGALGDKVRPATSYLTWATKARDRWFDLDSVRSGLSDKTKANLAAPNSQARTTARGGMLDNDTVPDTIAYGVNPAGAPPLDWWCIPPGGYSGSHYAVFPAELCRIPIEASCPRRVCRTCGVPSRRVVDAQRIEVDNRDAASNVNVPGRDGYASHGDTTYSTTGWTTCGCPGTDGIRLDGFHDGAGWRAGVVLDPFAGSGTTLLAASGRSRDAIGLDLDSRNADLARERLGMLLTVDELPPRPQEVVNL